MKAATYPPHTAARFATSTVDPFVANVNVEGPIPFTALINAG